MKKKDIHIGETYMAKVAGATMAVRIDREHPHGGWEGTNTRTSEIVHIKNAEWLRFNCSDPRRVPIDEPDAPTEAATPKRMSMLTAAVKVLEERISEGPMNCAEIMRHIAEKGYWSPARGGRTPTNTLYSAITREINTKGDASRFVKSSERGRFALASHV